MEFFLVLDWYIIELGPLDVFCRAFFGICAVIPLLLECIFKYHSDCQLKCLLSVTLNCLGGVSCRVLTPTWMWNSSWFQCPFPDWLPQFGSFNNCQQNSPIKQLSSLYSNWDNNPPQLNPFQNVLDVQLQTCCAQTRVCLFQPLWRSLLGLVWERPVAKQQPALCCIKLSLLLLVAKYFTPSNNCSSLPSLAQFFRNTRNVFLCERDEGHWKTGTSLTCCKYICHVCACFMFFKIFSALFYFSSALHATVSAC